ncbi:FAD-binding oxidoreductase [Sulfuriroseicoccus oceanibius]|uniref:FAD-binding oxidoreductase n=1 Tax=Sulfuriroseicoccus oceanibius TaxID=2707525 RepID=A0A6B3L6R2_9BACT|nr:FAD-binding oxidoreductase [Sulfuriroseicoccus oceanibius]QQL44872.1 FAD-binding oxidoreductase [Sulfuriroseicoccus oceanibius]
MMKPTLNSQRKRGLALVTVLALMSLLIVLLLGLFSLATSDQSAASQSKNQSEARANAKMALMMALGELQEASGWDQRVTATASIVDGVADEKMHWAGVWSTEQWDPTDPNDNKFFERWLVSGNLARAFGLEAVRSGFTGDSELVEVVGRGSVTPGDEVRVEKVVSNVDEFAYGFWIGDQGTKASFGVARSSEVADWDALGGVISVDRFGLGALEDVHPGLATYGENSDEMLSKASVSAKMADLLHGEGLSKETFHDIAPMNLSLLTDVRNGGDARDLSTAFELSLDEFNRLEEFHGSNERNVTNFYSRLSGDYNDAKFYGEGKAPNLGYVAEIREGDRASGLLRGPSWDLMRNHYRFYKKEWDASTSWKRAYRAPEADSFAARGSLPHTYSNAFGNPIGRYGYRGGPSAFYGKGFRGYWAMTKDLLRARGGFNEAGPGGMRVEQSPQLTPIVTRIAIAIGLVKHESPNWKLALSFDPYFTVVNPYNVPISFQSVGIYSAKFSPLDAEFEYVDRSSGRKVRVTKGQPFSPNLYGQGAFAVRLAPPAGQDAWVLQPGEVKVVSPAKVVSGGAINWENPTGVQGQFSYSEGSGLYWNHLHLYPREGTTVKVRLRGKNGTEATMFVNSLFYAKDHSGRGRDLMTDLPPKQLYGDNDIMDDPALSKVNMVSCPDLGGQFLFAEREVNTSQIPTTRQASAAYVAVLDLKMKGALEDTPAFWLNPRGKAFDTREYDGTGRVGPMWTATLDRINDLSELEIVGNPQGNGFWGEGYTAQDGSDRVVLYEVPRLPMTSLAQFQHVDTGVMGSGGSLQIGNSFAHPGISDTTAILGRKNRSSGRGVFPVEKAMQSLGDLAWASNEMLWDRYFFSGVNWGDSELALNGAKQPYATHDEAVTAMIERDSDAHPFYNSRIVMSGLADEDLTEAKLKRYDQIGRFLAIKGGFNVNSTSKDAWRAVFSSLRDAELKYVDGGNVRELDGENVFSRFSLPTAKPNDPWAGGYHSLNDAQIDALAEAMVEQVKERGPFMGMSDFVNRRLDSTKGSLGTDVGVLGALQAAIEKAGLNSRPEVSNPVTHRSMSHRRFSVAGETRDFSTYVGAPGYLMQGDILSSLGSTLRARSDTFVIRAYGEKRNPDGSVNSQAWCEAVVQRSPNWIEPTDEQPTEMDPSYNSNSPKGDVVVRPWRENSAFPELNRKFGRRYKVISFRWLTPDEV